MIEVFVGWKTELYALGAAVASFLAAAGTLVVLAKAAKYAKREVDHARQEREAALVARISTRWNEASMEEARQLANTYKNSSELLEAMTKFDQYNSRFYYVLERIPGFFEDLGLVCCKDDKLIPLVKDLIGPSVKYYYELYSPWTNQMKDDPTQGTYPFFKKLAGSM